MKTLFQKIADKEIKAEIIYEDSECFAIRDIHPQAPTHVLVIPRKPIDRLANASLADKALLGHLLLSCAEVARAAGIGEGFRVVINNGDLAGQTVFHLHLHVLGGRPLSWPPG